jgi:NAD(P)-dependent dehydrogenase (short-subunit alcohol dehydrogenase family)
VSASTERRSVLVTGAAGGIGRGIVRRFVAEGWTVAAVDRISDPLRLLAADTGDAVLPIVADLSTWEANRDAVAEAIHRFGRLDALVANAGIYDQATRLDQIDGDQLAAAFTELFAINVGSYLYLARAAMTELTARRGSIVMTASFASFSPGGGGVLYTAAKHAVLGIVRQLAYELAPDVRVNAVAPGVAPTRLGGIDALGHAPRDSVLPGSAQALPLGEVPEADAYAGLYTLLASEQARTMTGSVITADSGLSVRGIAPAPPRSPDRTPAPAQGTDHQRSA